MKKILFVIIVLLISYAAKGQLPTYAVVYDIGQSNPTRIVGNLTCDQIINDRRVKIRVIKNKKAIRHLYKEIQDASNLYQDSFSNSFDATMRIVFMRKKKCIKSICWARTNKVYIDGVIYRSGPKILEALQAAGLVYIITESGSYEHLPFRFGEQEE